VLLALEPVAVRMFFAQILGTGTEAITR